uniref:Dolichol-phosphate mannosyltransferase subunit 3 n=1 Tax=Tetraselmis sp. GSL018 TaxID=582737 RepID=A0A061RXF9_9CHLO|mmetsp:Transcript_18303/g.43782  ORF Transcript_18303/g.43782 Transcript_18303/m.43782 type:complete len:91 (-) Transcript_18303:267-539(-)
MKILWAAGFLVAGAALWIPSLRATEDTAYRVAVLFAPLWGMLVFGLYCALSLLHGVLTFRSCPEEHESLLKDIAKAKAELATLKVLGDSG